MSRIGKQPITVPSGVNVTIEASNITVTGPKGTLQQFTMPGIKVVQEGDNLIVTRASDELVHKSKHGLMRSLLSNMVDGVSKGFTKQLEINGVGYRVAPVGNSLRFNLGFSHDV